MLQAQQFMNSGELARALEVSERLAREAPDAPDALQLLAMCRTQTGDFDGAEKAFRKALEQAPDHPLILVNLATMLRRAGRPAEAMRAYRRATDKAGNLPAAWIGLGRTARECGQLEVAESALEHVLKLQPESAAAWHELGRMHRAAEEYEKARDAFAKAIRLSPEKGVYETSLGVCERMLGRPETALACFERAAKKGFASAELEDARIGALLDCGRSEEALQAAESLIDRHPDFVPAYTTMADLLWEYGEAHGRAEDPADLFSHAIGQQTNNRELRRAFAEFLLKARRSEHAIEVIRSLRHDEDGPILMTLEANALENAGRTEESAPLYRKAHGILGDSRADFLDAYTRHLLRAGEWREAEARAQAAVRVAPSDQEAWAYLATAWRLLGDEREFWLCDYDRTITFLEVPPPAGYEGHEDHLQQLLTFLETLHQASREPIQQSLRRGSQTAGRLFGRPQQVIIDTQQALTSAIEGWLARLPDDDEHPFFRRNTGRIRYTGSWSVKLWSSGNHVNHIHPEGWISSAYYIALPPSVAQHETEDDTAGCIQFGQPPSELGLDLPPRRVIHPRVGYLALFPSYMWHGTVPFEDSHSRITIAFDMRARPN